MMNIDLLPIVYLQADMNIVFLVMAVLSAGIVACFFYLSRTTLFNCPVFGGQPTLVLPDNIEHVELMLKASPPKPMLQRFPDTDPWYAFDRNFRPGKAAVEVGHQIPVRAFERGELPA